MRPAHPKYPAKKNTYMRKFLQKLGVAAVADTLGAGVCWMLTQIVTVEDQNWYAGPVTFYNPQLCDRCGMISNDTLDRWRRKAIEGGFLAYTPGGESRPGMYHVTLPAEMDDETLYESDTEKEDDDESTETRPEVKAPKAARPTPQNHPGFEAFAETYPKREKLAEARKVWNRLKPDADLAARIVRAVNAQKIWKAVEWAAEGGRWIPLPANWLKTERWTDEPSTTNGSQNGHAPHNGRGTKRTARPSPRKVPQQHEPD